MLVDHSAASLTYETKIMRKNQVKLNIFGFVLF